ncbi:MAG: DeoR/GlpR family DNA-binding transcription regulator [Pleomorphochaeta sp.]
MLGKERREAIKEYIQNCGKVTVLDLSKRWDVTEETIRRDLDKIEAQNFITRIHGGAIWNIGSQIEGVHFYSRRAQNYEAKLQIAKIAADLFKKKTTILADSSSTVVETLKTISINPDVIVVTNSVEIYQELNDARCMIISTGGTYNKKSLSFQDTLAMENIRKYNVELALISCKGLDIEKGILDSYESEAEVKKVMLNQAKEVALLVDHSKFNQSAFLQLTDLNKINYIITDKKPDEKWVEYCKTNGIKLIF